MSGSWTADVHRERLDNGLTLLIQRIPAPAVAVVTWVRAGFFDEPDHWGGISHVLEHMYFKGTATRGPGEIARATKAVGGYLNAGTGYDHTSYYTVLPASGLPEAIAIQSDALQHSTLDMEELQRELQVIIQEANRKLDQPAAVAWETLHEVMYRTHRIRRWRIGTEAMLAGFTREDVAAYYRSRYVPERTIVAITGDVDLQQARQLALESYGDWPAMPAAVDPSPTESDPPMQGTRTLRGDVVQSELVLGWRGSPPLGASAEPLDLLAAVLSGGRASRLQQAVRDPGLASGVIATHYAPTELGVFVVAATLEPERVNDVLTAIGREVAVLREHCVPQEELERARTLLLTRRARRLESVEGRASALAGAEALGGIDLLDREEARLLAVTPHDVRAAARTFLHATGVSGVVFHPHERGDTLESSNFASAFAQEAPACSARPAPSPPPRVEFLAPPPSARATKHEAGIWHLALPGTDLLVVRKVGVPLATLGVYRRRSAPDPDGAAGVAALAVRSAVRGAGSLNSAGLADAFERMGGVVAPTVSHDLFGFTTTVLAEHATRAAGLLRAVLDEPTFDGQTVEVERQLLAEAARRAADDMYRYPVQLALAARFGARGYGLPLVGTAETIPTLQPTALREWHASELRQGRTTLIAVGDFDPERASAEFARVFGMESREAYAMSVGDEAPVERVPTKVVSRDRTQSAFAMFFPGPSRTARDRHAAEVWAAVAGGLGGRLFESLRSQRSLAYTVVATSWQRPRAGGLLTYIAMAPEREDEARDAMLAELERFREQGVSDPECREAIAYLAGQAAVSRQTAAALVRELLDAWLAGDGLAELLDPEAPYRAVTPEAVRSVTARYLLPEQRVEGVVRGTGAAT